jgi:hypothetical protein
MKNLTLVLAFIIGTSFAMTAQRGSSNSNNRDNNSNYNNSSQLNRNPNLGQTNKRRGSGNNRHNYNSGNHHNNHNSHHSSHNNHHNSHHSSHNNHYNGHHNNHNSHYGHNNGHNSHHNNHSTHVSFHGNSHGYGHYSNHNHGWNSVCVADFNRGCSSIRHYGFDSDRLCAAKRFASNHHLTVNQVREIMHMFTFESTKLKFAKYAFGRTCDVQNYYLVFDCLTFNSSRRELDCYINNHFY